MERKSGNNNSMEIKNHRIHINLDSSMIDKLKQIRRETGISISELIRESIRRLIQESNDTGSFNIRVR